VEAGTASIRKRGGKNLGALEIDSIVKILEDEIKSRG
jgi:threonyl-tRNA synthetase